MPSTSSSPSRGRGTRVRTTTHGPSTGLVVALAGCQATQTRPGSDTAPAQSTAQEHALYGQWQGSWDGGGGKIGITIREAGETPEVTYCFKEHCWDPADVALDGATLTFTAQGTLRYRFEPDGERLRATLKKDGRTFRSKMKRVASETAAATEAPQTTSQPAAAPEPTGLAALAGRWTGRWGGQAKSTLTVSTDPESVEYCFKGECWDIEEFTFEEDTLRWSHRSSVMEFTLKGEKLRGTLTRPHGTYRITMKRS